MRHDGDGQILEVGARTRTIPPAIRRALHHRDRGCRFPGCELPFGQGHHIRHWAHGGPTTLSNLAMLCRRHRHARILLDPCNVGNDLRSDEPKGGRAASGHEAAAALSRVSAPYPSGMREVERDSCPNRAGGRRPSQGRAGDPARGELTHTLAARAGRHEGRRSNRRAGPVILNPGRHPLCHPLCLASRPSRRRTGREPFYRSAPRLEKRVSWLVMNSSSAACPLSVALRARAKAPAMSSGRSTRSLQPPMARPRSA